MGLALLVAERLTSALTGPGSNRVRKAISGLFLLSILGLGAQKIVQRNRDWESDATLFGSALKVRLRHVSEQALMRVDPLPSRAS